MRTKSGSVPVPYECERPQLSECPVSAITQRSVDLVQIVNTLMTTQAATGSTIPADRLPGHLVDAIKVCRSESRAADIAQDEAIAARG